MNTILCLLVSSLFTFLLWIVQSPIPCKQHDIFLFKHPLFNPSTAIVEQSLLGTFVFHEVDTCEGDLAPGECDSFNYLHIGSACNDTKGMMEIISVDTPVGGTKKVTLTRQIFFTKKIGEHFVIQLPISRNRPVSDPAIWRDGKFDGYLFARLDLKNDELRCETLNPETINELATSGSLDLLGNQNPSDFGTILTETKRLQELLLRGNRNTFSQDSPVFRRVMLKNGK